jgi:hypothetical protein
MGRLASLPFILGSIGTVHMPAQQIKPPPIAEPLVNLYRRLNVCEHLDEEGRWTHVTLSIGR